jgi:molecular chaperone GrpE
MGLKKQAEKKPELDQDVKIEEELDEDAGVQIRKLKQKLKKCLKEKEEYLTGWQRARAEFINSQKEEARRREEIIKFANEKLILELLTILDSFDLALKSLINSKNEKRKTKVDEIERGVCLIQSQLKDLLEKHGLRPIKSEGERFNPELHETVAEVESEKEDGIVLEELQKGYLLYDKVIRPARVKISKHKKM